MTSGKISYNTHILGQMSEKVFRLPDEEKGIIHTIAENGPSIISKIAEKTSNYGKWECNRWAVKKRIDGTGDFIGLKECEYVIEKDHKTRIQGKDGKEYFLSTKGMFASLAKLSLNQIYLYKNYMNFIKRILEYSIQQKNNTYINEQDRLIVKCLMHICKNFVKFRILTFLVWHDLTRKDLQKLRSSQWYINDFFEREDEFLYKKIPKHISETKDKKYKGIFRNNQAYTKLFQSLVEISTGTNPKFQQNDPFIKSVKDYFATVARYVWYWPYHMERCQFYTNPETYSENPIPIIEEPPVEGIDIEADGESGKKIIIKPRIYDFVKQELQPLKIENDKLDGLLRDIWHKPLKPAKILEFG